jgi:shikimate kinase
MPGSGKSTVGRALARQLQMDWADTDLVIEQRLGCTVRAYFDQHGEAAFRDVEESLIDELTLGSPIVLATGGGAVLRPANRQRLRQRGTVIYLRSSPEQLYRRLRHDTKRPLLQVADPLQRLREMYAERDPLYRECAHYVIDTHGYILPTLVDRVLMQLELTPTPPAEPPAA